MLNERLKQVEIELANVKKETINYQNMLQQSQEQFSNMEKKYTKAKRLLRDYQQRDRDMVSSSVILKNYSTRWPPENV